MEQKQNMSDVAGDDESPLKIRRILAKNGVFLKDSQETSLKHLVTLLREWNKKVNLVSRRDVENVWLSHVLHSLSIMLEVTLPERAQILDLGSGGGLPGLPLAIVRPDVQVVMLDATRKKIEAIRDMTIRLGITNTSTVWGRAEDPDTVKSLSGRFDVVIARAVAPLADLEKWSRPLVKHSTKETPHLIALKGGDLDAEVDQVRQKSSVKEVTIKDITFYGSENIPGVEKKIITLRFVSKENEQ